MRQILTIATLCAFVVGTAFAGTSGAHFFSASAAVDSSGNLVVSFDEAGLGNFSGTVGYEVDAQGSAEYVCINGGGNHPKAANKENAAGPVSGFANLTPSKNGRVTGRITVNPPASTLTCPSGQTFALAAVRYCSITLTDETNGVSAAGVLSPTDTGTVNLVKGLTFSLTCP